MKSVPPTNRQGKERGKIEDCGISLLSEERFNSLTYGAVPFIRATNPTILGRSSHGSKTLAASSLTGEVKQDSSLLGVQC